MGERLSRNLVSQSLFKAVAAKRPANGLIHHSGLSFTVPKAKSCLGKVTFHYIGGIQYEAAYLGE
jgi:hypothetical protein